MARRKVVAMLTLMMMVTVVEILMVRIVGFAQGTLIGHEQQALQSVLSDPEESRFVVDPTVQRPQIVNLAFGKSGTTSLTVTLAKMGFSPLHWFARGELSARLCEFGRADLLLDPSSKTMTYFLVDVVLNLISKKESLETLSALDASTQNKFRAFTEIPMWYWPECKYPQITHLDELVALNPNAKFILTVREIHSHVNSMIKWKPARWMGGEMAKCANLSLDESLMQPELEKWVTDTNNRVKKRMAAFSPPVPLLELEVAKDPISKLMWHVFPDGRVPPSVMHVMETLHNKFPQENINSKLHEAENPTRMSVNSSSGGSGKSGERRRTLTLVDT